MITITYSADQKILADQIRSNLSQSGFKLAHPVLLVLVSAESNSDPSVLDEIKRALQKRYTVIPILAESVTLPEILDAYQPLNFTSGYKQAVLMTRLSQPTMSNADVKQANRRALMSNADVKQANRRALIVIGGIAFFMFLVGIISIMDGIVAFPVDEYNEEATFQAEWNDGLIVETLEYVQPRTTQDALNFQSTLEVAPTRLYLYIRETATAIPKSQGD